MHGLISEGLETYEKALGISREKEMIFEEPELWRLKGELSLYASENNAAVAEDCFIKAIRSASAQGTTIWEMRATVSLARLWKNWERLEVVRYRWNDIYGWFTEGLETPDLIWVKKCIHEISTKPN